MMKMEDLEAEFEQALLSIDRLEARKIFMEGSIEQEPIQFVESLITPVLQRIGAGWEKGNVSLSQVYMSGRICEELVDTFLPPYGLNRNGGSKMAIATLQDYHMLGKRMVCTALRAGGFELRDYGRVMVDDLVARIKKDGIKLLLISVLMLPSALKVRELREKLNAAGLNLKIVVGGAPFLFDDKLYKEVGADAMGRYASEAVDIIAGLTGDI